MILEQNYSHSLIADEKLAIKALERSMRISEILYEKLEIMSEISNKNIDISI